MTSWFDVIWNTYACAHLKLCLNLFCVEVRLRVWSQLGVLFSQLVWGLRNVRMALWKAQPTLPPCHQALRWIQTRWSSKTFSQGAIVFSVFPWKIPAATSSVWSIFLGMYCNGDFRWVIKQTRLFAVLIMSNMQFPCFARAEPLAKDECSAEAFPATKWNGNWTTAVYVASIAPPASTPGPVSWPVWQLPQPLQRLPTFRQPYLSDQPSISKLR